MPRAMNESLFEGQVLEEEDDDLNPDEVRKTGTNRQGKMIIEQAKGGVLPKEKDEELIGDGGDIQENDFTQLDPGKSAKTNPKSKKRLIGNYPKID